MYPCQEARIDCVREDKALQTDRHVIDTRHKRDFRRDAAMTKGALAREGSRCRTGHAAQSAWSADAHIHASTHTHSRSSGGLTEASNQSGRRLTLSDMFVLWRAAPMTTLASSRCLCRVHGGGKGMNENVGGGGQT